MRNYYRISQWVFFPLAESIVSHRGQWASSTDKDYFATKAYHTAPLCFRSYPNHITVSFRSCVISIFVHRDIKIYKLALRQTNYTFLKWYHHHHSNIKWIDKNIVCVPPGGTIARLKDTLYNEVIRTNKNSAKTPTALKTWFANGHKMSRNPYEYFKIFASS